MYESLKYYVLKAWALGLYGEAAIEYVCAEAGVKRAVVAEVIEMITAEMSE